MAEPLFGAAFFLGILGNWIARHGDPATRSFAEVIVSRLRDKEKGLPPNHDVERVCRLALRETLEFLAQQLDLHVARPRNLGEAIQNRFDAQGKWKPILEFWHTEEGEWFDEFVKAIASDSNLATFDLGWIREAAALEDPLRSAENAELKEKLGKALNGWIELHVRRGKAPAVFAEWLKDGWPIAPDSPSIRISFYQAWCLFLQQHFKDDQKVQAILSAAWLASIDERLRNWKPDAASITAALREPLGEQLAMLVKLRDAVASLSANFEGLKSQTAPLLGVVLGFRNEVGVGFSDLARLLAQSHGLIHAETVAIHKDVREVLQQVNVLIAAQQRPAPVIASTAGLVKRIAKSEILFSDGSARLEKLIGRSHEKRELSRIWNQKKVRVVSLVAWGGAGKSSIVTDWLKDHLEREWEGVDAFLDWTFYSQGTRDQGNATCERFLNYALRHFGEDAVADSSRAGEEKAAHIAGLLEKQRTILVLDGLEPLQHPRKPGQVEGRLKDNAMHRLLVLLAQSSGPVLCIITTRVPVVDLRAVRGRKVEEILLNHLSVRDGAELLHLAGAKFAGAAAIQNSDRELLATAREMKGHAMTLQMLGGYLGSARKGDIRRRHEIDFNRFFEDQLEGHTYQVMAAYEEWFKAEGPRGQRQLAVLRMLGLFDRVANAGCIKALREGGGVSGVSDFASMSQLSEEDWENTLALLSEHKLVFRDRKTESLDAHPLVREFFAQQMRKTNLNGWREAHGRIFKHLCETTQEGEEPTLEQLQPLYQAVAHGCHAELQREALGKVYFGRILRGQEFYSSQKLGALGSNLGAVACFFKEPWRKVSAVLSEDEQAWLLNEAAYYLRALGRLTEAVEPRRAGLEMRIGQKDWRNAAIGASNLSELELTLGNVAEAVMDGRASVTYADDSGDAFQKMSKRTTRAEAAHQAGQRMEAEGLFREAERMQNERQDKSPLLYSVQGFLFCDLLLGAAERAGWAVILGERAAPGEREGLIERADDVSNRAMETIKIATRHNWLLDIGLDHLTLARAELYRSILTGAADQCSEVEMEKAVEMLRRAGNVDYLPRGLLSRARGRFLNGKKVGPGSAQEDLDEAWEIAERGPMRLFMADIHLYRARLFFREKEYPWADWERWHTDGEEEKKVRMAADDLLAAERLINSCGYGRRKEELEDAKRVIVGEGIH